jgi:SWI/SNF-related matrix-associated actin-dependent regulator of chromatin subfamily A-like protein 1
MRPEWPKPAWRLVSYKSGEKANKRPPLKLIKMENFQFEIRPAFARSKNIPVIFIGTVLKETQKAIYVYGRGSTETRKTGRCCICGRELTHPVSVELGIGPECGKHYWDWDMIGGYTPENIERLKGELQNIKVDTWMPKSIVLSQSKTGEMVSVPNGHPMTDQPAEAVKSGKSATLTSYKSTGDPAIKVEFPFSYETVDQVKRLNGRRFINEGAKKYWVCPATLENIQSLLAAGFELDEGLANRLKELLNPITVNDVPPMEVNGLFPFQQKGVAFIEAKNGRALIADEMGLGKTVQALAWLDIKPEKRPVIIVVPASLKLNWAKEAQKWMPNTKPKVQILSGSTTNIPIIGELIIINYDILHAWVDVLLGIRPQVLVLDEAHYFKNNTAKRTKAVKKLGKHIKHVIALSGTPIVNRPVEIWNAVQLIDASVFGRNFMAFARRYCAAKYNGFGWDFNGASNTQELHKKLTDSIMIRRQKYEVLTDLPDKIYASVPIALDNEKEYRYAENDFIEFIRQYKGAEAAARASAAEALAEIEGLKQLAMKGKMKQTLQWIQDFLESGDKKLVVFAIHKATIDTLMEEFGAIAVKIDGSVSQSARNEAVEKFQNNVEIRLFVGNIKAAGVGLTLTAASNVAVLELPWSPGDLSQAEDRCHRIGQKDSVTIHYLLAVGTIEERLATLIDSKREVLDQVVDGKETAQSSLLSELLEGFI